MRPVRSTLTEVGGLLLCKATLCVVVLASGFRAVSDDDFARIVHAQEWAVQPKLDPTGTSWLPFPFWINGAAMSVFGTDVAVAKGVALVIGIASALLVYAAARLLFERRVALFASVLACSIPWSARLAVATVPEWPTAALCLFGIAALAQMRADVRLGGAIALWCAALSRYEPWPLVGLFALMTGVDLLRRRLTGRHASLLAVTSIAAAVSAPLWWIAHNAQAHGDPLHFLARVSAYKKAVGGSVGVLQGYPLALIREEPELMSVFAVLLIWQWVNGVWATRVAERAGVKRAFAAALLLLVTLSLAALPGGAPTHHYGRAVLMIWLLVALMCGVWGPRLLAQADRAGAAVAASAIVAVMVVAAVALRPWYARLDSFTARTDEVAIGRAAGQLMPRDGRAIIQAIDYGYFAIQAGSGAPERLLVDRTLDPRAATEQTAFRSSETLRRHCLSRGIRYVIAHDSDVTGGLGAPLSSSGAWHLWQLSEQADPSRSGR